MIKRKGQKTFSPNVIFFFSDQQRWDTLGCYGQQLDVTPNLDRMAAEGVKFEYAFSCQPVCGPARSAIQTGKWPTRTGCFRNNIALPLDQKTIAHWFTEAGYEVAYIGKWHLASTGSPSDSTSTKSAPSHRTMIYDYRTKPIPPERRGGYKDYWVASDLLEFTSHGYGGHMFDSEMNKIDLEGYRADAITDIALGYLRSHDNKKPFFLFISPLEPHHQNDYNQYEGPVGSKEKFKDFQSPGDLKDAGGDWRKNYPDYLGCCNSLDYNLGRIRNEIEKLGLADNTVIFYTSDHGSHFKTRNKEYKRSCHEASIRIPLIVCGPGFNGGKIVKDLVSLIDVPPTLLACAGIKKPDVMDGNSLQRLIEGDNAEWPEEISVQISESQVGRAIRTSKWKYAVVAPGKDGRYYFCSDVYEEKFLYNLENDPHEQNNLINEPDYEGTRQNLRGILKRRMKAAGEEEPKILVASEF